MTLSNKLTLSRIFFAPIFFFIYYIPVWTLSNFAAKVSSYVMLPLLVIFELTDYFDGYFARKHNKVSNFGKLFDPFADVILNLTIFTCALNSISNKYNAYIPIFIFIFIIYREFFMLFLRMIVIQKGTAIAARKSGKLKTVLYIVSGFFAIAIESSVRLGFNLDSSAGILKNTAVILFSCSLILSYVSFLDYIIKFSSLFKK